MKGLIRILNSSKGVAAAGALTGIYLVNMVGMDPVLAERLSGAILILASLYIGATGFEDLGKK